MIQSPFKVLDLPSTTRKIKELPIIVDSNNVHLGIPGSSVTTLSLQPPRTLATFAVSPATTIDSLAAQTNQDSTNLWLATSERKKHLLCSTNGDETPLAQPAYGLHVAADTLIAVFKDGQVSSFAADTLKETGTIKLPGTVLFSCDIDMTAVLVVLHTDVGSTLAQIVGPGRNTVLKLAHTQLEPGKEPLHFAYNDYMLYVSRLEDPCIEVYNLSELNTHEAVQVPLKEPISSIVALGNNQVLVTHNSSVSVIDCKFKAVLDTRSCSEDCRLLAYIAEIECAVSLENSQIFGLNVAPTSGSLIHALRKGASLKSQESPFKYGFTDFLSQIVQQRDDFKGSAQDLVAKAQKDNQAIVRDLENFVAAGDGDQFSRIIDYMTSTKSWDSSEPKTSACVYSESDKQLDSTLFRVVVNLAFNITDKVHGFHEFLSESVGIYLLTHPLFPTNANETRNLMQVLEKKSPLLYRQAIVSLAGISVQTLLVGLISPSEEIFADSVSRLSEEFSEAQIRDGIHSTFGGTPNLAKLVRRLSLSEAGWALLGPFVDAIGLLGWDGELVEELEAQLKAKLGDVEGNRQVSQAVSELLRSVGLDLSSDSPITQAEFKRKAKTTRTSLLRERPVEVPRYSVETLRL